jgi:hypothetical protein
MTQLQQLCQEWAIECWGQVPENDMHHYMLQDHNSTSMYRTLASSTSITPRSSAEQNLDLWFQAVALNAPSPGLKKALLYYQPHVEGKSNHFVLIFATPQQQEAAWKFGHNNQMLFDGIFGVCSTWALLFILMAIYDHNKGIPIMFFLFMAKPKAHAVHSDYNGELLAELLGYYKNAMGTRAGKSFNIKVAITDNDPHEQQALSKN